MAIRQSSLSKNVCILQPKLILNCKRRWMVFVQYPPLNQIVSPKTARETMRERCKIIFIHKVYKEIQIVTVKIGGIYKTLKKSGGGTFYVRHSNVTQLCSCKRMGFILIRHTDFFSV